MAVWQIGPSAYAGGLFFASTCLLPAAVVWTDADGARQQRGFLEGRPRGADRRRRRRPELADHTGVARPHWAGTQWGQFGADFLLLLLITAIAIRTRRYWPLTAAAFQLLCVLIHVARLIDPNVRAWAYATGEVIFTQFFLFAIGVGVWGTWRQSRREREPGLS